MSKIELMKRIAEATAEESKCIKHKVGAVIFNSKDIIISVGYNGTPAGIINCCDAHYINHHDWSEEHEVHAEVNAIVHAHTDLAGCSIYCTLEPCVQCLKVIAAAGIKHVYFGERHFDYTHEEIACTSLGITDYVEVI